MLQLEGMGTAAYSAMRNVKMTYFLQSRHGIISQIGHDSLLCIGHHFCSHIEAQSTNADGFTSRVIHGVRKALVIVWGRGQKWRSLVNSSSQQR
jgi:hypothetical protein